jgi:hypothetical protein
VLAIYTAVGALPLPLPSLLPGLALIAMAGALVESLPYPDIDNVTVTLAAVAFGHLLLGG